MDAHVVVRDTRVFGVSQDVPLFVVSSYQLAPVGIVLDGVGNATIEGNELQGPQIGVHVRSSSGVAIQGNTFREPGPSTDFPTAVRIEESQNNTITSNTVSEYDFGVLVTDADGNLIQDNLLRGNFLGVGIWEGSGNVIRSNTISMPGRIGLGFGSGISLAPAPDTLVLNNTIRGIDVADTSWYGVRARAASDGLVLRGNAIAGTAGGPWVGPGATGVWIPGVPDRLTLLGNEVVWNNMGVLLGKPRQPPEEGPVLRDNEVWANRGPDLRVGDLSARVDARANWWGHPSGPSGGLVDACTGALADGHGANLQAGGAGICFDPARITRPGRTAFPPQDTQDPLEEPEVAGVGSSRVQGLTAHPLPPGSDEEPTGRVILTWEPPARLDRSAPDPDRYVLERSTPGQPWRCLAPDGDGWFVAEDQATCREGVDPGSRDPYVVEDASTPRDRFLTYKVTPVASNGSRLSPETVEVWQAPGPSRGDLSAGQQASPTVCTPAGCQPTAPGVPAPRDLDGDGTLDGTVTVTSRVGATRLASDLAQTGGEEVEQATRSLVSGDYGILSPVQESSSTDRDPANAGQRVRDRSPVGSRGHAELGFVVRPDEATDAQVTLRIGDRFLSFGSGHVTDRVAVDVATDARDGDSGGRADLRVRTSMGTPDRGEAYVGLADVSGSPTNASSTALRLDPLPTATSITATGGSEDLTVHADLSHAANATTTRRDGGPRAPNGGAPRATWTRVAANLSALDEGPSNVRLSTSPGGATRVAWTLAGSPSLGVQITEVEPGRASHLDLDVPELPSRGTVDVRTAGETTVFDLEARAAEDVGPAGLFHRSPGPSRANAHPFATDGGYEHLTLRGVDPVLEANLSRQPAHGGSLTTVDYQAGPDGPLPRSIETLGLEVRGSPDERSEDLLRIGARNLPPTASLGILRGDRDCKQAPRAAGDLPASPPAAAGPTHLHLEMREPSTFPTGPPSYREVTAQLHAPPASLDLQLTHCRDDGSGIEQRVATASYNASHHPGPLFLQIRSGEGTSFDPVSGTDTRVDVERLPRAATVNASVERNVQESRIEANVTYRGEAILGRGPDVAVDREVAPESSDPNRTVVTALGLGEQVDTSIRACRSERDDLCPRMLDARVHGDDSLAFPYPVVSLERFDEANSGEDSFRRRLAISSADVEDLGLRVERPICFLECDLDPYELFLPHRDAQNLDLDVEECKEGPYRGCGDITEWPESEGRVKVDGVPPGEDTEFTRIWEKNVGVCFTDLRAWTIEKAEIGFSLDGSIEGCYPNPPAEGLALLSGS